MPSLQIPREHYQGFEILLRFDDKSMQRLVSSLSQIKPTLRLKDFNDQMALLIPQIPTDDFRQIIPVIIALYRLIDKNPENRPSLVSDVIEAIRDAEGLNKPADWKAEIFATYLKQILSVEQIDIIAKATSVLLDHERVYSNARVLTDIRPVFSSDVAIMPTAVLIVHMLKIGYHENGEHKEFYVALDTEDVRKLQETLERATTKDKSLKDLLGQTNLSYLATERQE